MDIVWTIQQDADNSHYIARANDFHVYLIADNLDSLFDKIKKYSKNTEYDRVNIYLSDIFVFKSEIENNGISPEKILGLEVLGEEVLGEEVLGEDTKPNLNERM